MGLLPLDIQQKTFRAALRGYAEDEVDEFLDDVVVSMREFEQRVTEAEAEIKELRGQLNEGREAEDALRRTLVAAQRTADTITEEANRESERILSDARADASRVSVESGREKNQMLDELERLRGVVGDVRDRLASIAGDMTGRISDAGDEIDDAVSTYSRWDDPAEARFEKPGYSQPSPGSEDSEGDFEDTDEGSDEAGEEFSDHESEYELANDDNDDDDDDDDDDNDDDDDDNDDDNDDADRGSEADADLDDGAGSESEGLTAEVKEDAGDMAQSRSSRKPWER